LNRSAAQTAPTEPPAAPSSSDKLAFDAAHNPVLAATNDGVMDWDLTTGAIRYSERWKSLLGYEDHELADAPELWKELSHPDDVVETEMLLRDHVQSLWPFAHTWRMRHKNGDWRWSLCRTVTTQDDAGVPLRCIGVFTDVTDQVLAEKRLAELGRRIELLLVSAGEGFLGVDERALVTFANPAALQLLGRGQTNVVGMTLAQVVDHGCPPDRPCRPDHCPILAPLSSGLPNRVSNATFGRVGSPAFSADYVSTPARDDERIVGVVLTFRDVTEQRRMEAQRMQGQKLEALGQLAAGVAHEINTPMQYVGDNVFFLHDAFADLLRLIETYRGVLGELKAEAAHTDLVERAEEGESTADLSYLAEMVPKAIDSAQEGIGRVRKIVAAMKAFSHPGRTEKSPENLNEAIECTATISANVWKHVATMEMALDPDLPRVSCLLGEVNQVVLNLIVNAAHAIADARAKDGDSDKLGLIRIATGVKDGFAEIHISDSGGGIPEAVRHRLFEPFFTTKEVGRGTGQGLTLARSIIVDRHGGFINFTTELGKGTTFVVGLPLVEIPALAG
jgi:PAS domain S-box-containing protein